jgi:hypothetical protein
VDSLSEATYMLLIKKLSRHWLIILVLLFVFTLCPWLTKQSAQARALYSFNSGWVGVIDGCSTNCKGCGVVHTQRIPFGVFVKIEYACGLIPTDVPEYHHQTTTFLSAFGTVHGLRDEP